MTIDISDLEKLAVLIRDKSDELLALWRAQVRQLPSARHLDTPTLNDDIPILIGELTYAFQMTTDEQKLKKLLEGSAPVHGLQRFEHDFDIVEVVAEYNILRSCIYDLAYENGFKLQNNAFHILNHVFDDAIGAAVHAFATRQTLELQRRRDEYLAFVVHDLRTPLNAISLAAKILESASAEENGAKTAQMLSILHRNVNRLETLVEHVLRESAYVQTETAELERREFDLWPLVEGLIYDLGPLAKTGGTKLVNRIPKDLIAYADAGMLKRVFQNLVANAIKHTPRGEVVIDASKNDTGGIECRVSDNGEGISEDRLEKLFDRANNQTKKEKTSGLGLPIVKTLVEAHGGTVAVESKERMGSTFHFTLPAKAGK
jgi:signal transduction histidine kinase